MDKTRALVQRLHDHRSDHWEVRVEAADLIEAQAKRIEMMESSIKELIQAYLVVLRMLIGDGDNDDLNEEVQDRLAIAGAHAGFLSRARAALAGGKEETPDAP
jgi:glycerol-3-phosphate O-acyltransferase